MKRKAIFVLFNVRGEKEFDGEKGIRTSLYTPSIGLTFVEKRK